MTPAVSIDVSKLPLIKEILGTLHDYHVILNDPFRANAFLKIAKSINAKDLESIIAGQSVPGIGPGIAQRIKEIYRTDSLAEIGKLGAKKEIKSAKELMTIMGVGPVSAVSIMKAGYKSIDDLRGISKDKQKQLLTRVQLIGLKYHDQLLKRVPRSTITDVAKNIEKLLKKSEKDLMMTVVGSYRRGAKSSGDVDILVASSRNAVDILNAIKADEAGIVLDIINSGLQKTTFLTKVGHAIIQVDIFVCKPSEWIPHLLYGTGSAEHNIYLRTLAGQKGYHLSQHALSKEDKVIPLKAEEDIYKILGIDYVEPKKR